MSESIPESAAAPAQAPEQPAKPQTREERKANSAAALKEMLAAKMAAKAEIRNPPKPAAPPAPAAKAPESSSATAAKIESAGGEAPEQKDGESETSYQLRLAKTYRELKAAAAKAERLEQTGKTTQAELQKLQKLLATGKENPLEILEHLGIGFDDLVKGINADKFKKPQKNVLPPELQEKIDRLEAADKERREQALEAAKAAQRQKHESVVSDFLKEHSDRYPLSSAQSGIERLVVNYAYSKGQTDVAEILEEHENALVTELLPLVSSEKALAKILKSKPELKDQLLKVMGLSKAEVSDPASIEGLDTSPNTPDEKPSRAKLKAQAAAMLAERKAANKKK